MNSVELAIRMTADASDAEQAMAGVGDAAGRMASDVDDATRRCDDAGSRLDSVGESADDMASKSAQAAGGIGDLAGALAATGLISEDTAAAMELGSQAIMGVTGASDLLNLATTSNIVTQGKQKVATVANAVATRAQAVATKAAAVAQRVMNAAMRANPIGLVITAILLLVAGFVLAYKRSETFRRIVNAVMGAVKAYIMGVIKVLGAVVGWVRDKLPAAWTFMKAKAVALWGAIRSTVSAVVGRIVGYVVSMRDRVVAGWQVMREKAGAAWDWVRDKVATIIGNVKDKVATIKDAVASAGEAIRNKIGDAWDAVMDKLQPIIDAVQHIIDLAGKIHIPGMGRVIPGGLFGRTAAAPAALVGGGGDRVTIELPLLSRIDDRSVGQLVGALDDYYRRRGKVVKVVPA